MRPGLGAPLTLTLTALLAAHPAHATPDCLPRAAAAALTDLGDPIAPRALAAQLPIHRDGADVFDLHQWLPARGHNVRALAPDAVAALTSNGADAALILVTAAPAGAHAVYARRARDADAIALIQDPRASAPYRLPWTQALAGLRVALLIAHDRAPLRAALKADALRAIERTDAAFVATGWLRRAAELPADAYDDRLTLLSRALDADPCLPAARWATLRALLATPATPPRQAKVATLRAWCGDQPMSPGS